MNIEQYKLIHVNTKSYKVKYPYLVYKLSRVNSLMKAEYRLCKQFTSKAAALEYIAQEKK